MSEENRQINFLSKQIVTLVVERGWTLGGAIDKVAGENNGRLNLAIVRAARKTAPINNALKGEGE